MENYQTLISSDSMEDNSRITVLLAGYDEWNKKGPNGGGIMPRLAARFPSVAGTVFISQGRLTTLFTSSAQAYPLVVAAVLTDEGVDPNVLLA